MTENFVVIDKTFIMRGRSRRGGWSREQIQLLGIPWPMQHGWIARATGKLISRAKADRFLALKDAHLDDETFHLTGDAPGKEPWQAWVLRGQTVYHIFWCPEVEETWQADRAEVGRMLTTGAEDAGYRICEVCDCGVNLKASRSAQ